MGKIIAGVAVFAVFVIVCWFGWAFNSVAIAHWALGTIFIPTQAGPWGDLFGAFNALFGALGFTAVVGTFLLQGRALRVQQRDQHRQRFEDNFFQLLAVIRENREDVRFGYSKDYLAKHKVTSHRRRGHFAFQAAHREMLYWVREEKLAGKVLDHEALAALYAKKVHFRFESTLGAYFRLVYETLDRVNRDKFLSDDEKVEFGNLVRGQMTSFEATIAGCNALNDFAKDFKRLVIQFRLLKYAKAGDVYHELTKHYPPQTFQGRETSRPPVPEVDDDLDEDED